MKHNQLTKEFLNQKYVVEKLSTYSISKMLQIPQCTVHWYLKKYQIKGRSLKEANKNNRVPNYAKRRRSRNGETLKNHYCCEKGCNNLVTYQSALYGSGRCFSCKIKCHSQFLKGKKQSLETIQKRSLATRGSKHWNWKGGISPLGHMIRNLVEYKEWVKEVFKRDFWTCQICGYKGHDIEAHHKNSFNNILRKFLKIYDQFSPIEDKETLVRLATKYTDFWNIDNGITYCCKCHDKTRGGRNGKDCERKTKTNITGYETKTV